jgi:hypothetical protein
MTQPKKSFIKSVKPKARDHNWCVSVFGWRRNPDGTMSGGVAQSVETDDLGLALLAAHRMLDVHGPLVDELITVEIAAAELIDGGLV